MDVKAVLVDGRWPEWPSWSSPGRPMREGRPERDPRRAAPRIAPPTHGRAALIQEAEGSGVRPPATGVAASDESREHEDAAQAERGHRGGLGHGVAFEREAQV